MLSFLIALGLILLACLAVSLRKTYSIVPVKELKRQAEAGDPVAVTLWRSVAYGASLRTFLWLVIGFSSAAGFVMFARLAPPIYGFIAIAVLLWMTFAWLPNSRFSSAGLKLATTLTPLVAWLVSTLDPVLRRIGRWSRVRLELNNHTGLFERTDLLELIESQKQQTDNRLTLEELDLAANALRFGDKNVRDVMVPRKKVKAVNVGDTISPVYLDELHKTGHSRFPVYDDKMDNIIGSLSLTHLTDVSKGKGAKGKVADHLRHGVVYVHEKDSLAQALHAYYLTKNDLFVVVNKFEEYVGLLTVDDILHALLGKPGEHDFDLFDSKSAVAAKHNKKPKEVEEIALEPTDEVPTEENPPETPDEVVK